MPDVILDADSSNPVTMGWMEGLPPPPDKGVQYGVHPQGKRWFEQVSKGDMSGYDGLADEWTMAPGDEEQFNYQTSADNAEERDYYRNYARMRKELEAE